MCMWLFTVLGFRVRVVNSATSYTIYGLSMSVCVSALRRTRRLRRTAPPLFCGREQQTISALARHIVPRGSARLGSARFGSARLGSARLGSPWLGFVWRGTVRHTSIRCGCAFRLCRLLPVAECKFVAEKSYS